KQWLTLSFAWIAFFIFSGVLNLIVAYQFSEDIWVNFKLFGLLGLTFIFLVIQGVWISKHSSEAQAQPEDDHHG
ncbi:MAG: septation protein IspZ, partial [Gammaproteobacteria bacterium]